MFARALTAVAVSGVLALAIAAPAAAGQTITLDGASPGEPFGGVGGLSAGA